MMDTISKIWKTAKRDRGFGVSIFILLIWTLTALFAPLLEPILGGGFSVLQLENGLLPPLSSRGDSFYLLGTDYLGRNLFAGMIHGARVAFIVAVASVLISLILGLSIGLVIGFYGDKGIRKNLVQQVIIYASIVISIYYLISMIADGFSIYNVFPFFGVIGFTVGLDKLISKLPIKKYGVPLDMVMQRLFELREGLPGLFIILSIAAIIATQSIFSVAIIISILYWMTFARHARAETMQVKEEDYIVSAQSSGVSDFRLLFYHILPNAMPSIFVIIAFTFGAVILLESSLSFLGIGMPVEEVSWGKILAGARKSPKAWWLAVFPGMAIFLVLYAFNNLADYFGQYQRRNDRIEN
ncbi:MAG: peptide/nickel transport system permease protein [Saprospiraceae bacterium]|jgi:peptide/nickel transport system permease protein